MPNENQNPMDTSIYDQLQNLDAQFNPTGGFGLQGQMEADARRRAAMEAELHAPAADVPPAAPPQPALDSQIIQEVVAPLNDTIQSLNQRLAQYEQRLKDPQQGAAAAAPPAPTAPEGMTEDQKRFWEQEQRLNRMEIDNIYQKARNDLNAAKIKFPEANLTEEDLKNAWTSMNLSNNIAVARNADWGQHWELHAKAKSFENQAPKMEAQLKALTEELASLKANRNNPINDMAALPQTRRATSALPNGLQQSVDGVDEDLYRRASSRMGKRGFIGFNKTLLEEERNRSLNMGR